MGVPASQTRWFRHLSRNVPDLVCSSRGGVIDYINPAGARLLGYGDPTLLSGRPLSDLLRVSDRAVVEAGPSAPAAEGQAHPVVFLSAAGQPIAASAWIYRRGKGAQGCMLLYGQVSDEGQRPPSRSEQVFVLRDATEREQIEDKLRLAATVFETIAEGIMVLDASFRITAVNPAFTSITGYALDEVAGRQPRPARAHSYGGA